MKSNNWNIEWYGYIWRHCKGIKKGNKQITQGGDEKAQ